jgi:hypothetical protein
MHTNYQQKCRIVSLITILVAVILYPIWIPFSVAYASALPIITVWYEQNYQFGQLGNPQGDINILGNVRDSDGSVRSLTYSLNGGQPVSVPIGTDNIRLANAGDFNLSIARTMLRSGSNTVVITATDNSSDVAQKSVLFNYTPGRTWPLPYTTNWANGTIHSQAQVVDGLWQINSSSVRPTQVGYDRLIAIGDVSWTSYEVLVPITLHSFSPVGTDAGGVGIIVRWQGHIGTGTLPTGWTRLGAYGYYSNRLGGLALRLNDTNPYEANFTMQSNRPYLFKLKAETVAQGGRYSFKVWEQGQPEPAWTDSRFQNIVNRVDSSGDLLQGSILLVAHRADATFGNPTICPPNVTFGLNVQTTGSGVVNASPQKTSYQCGEGVTLQANPQAGWRFERWGGDVSSTSNPLNLNITKQTNIQAVFSLDQPVEQNFEIRLPVVFHQ